MPILDWENFLTEHVEHSADGKIWTITLLPDLKFSNGSPLTAQDVAFTYNQAAQGGGKIDMGNFSGRQGSGRPSGRDYPVRTAKARLLAY
ncbi:putative substrate-binding transport protein [Klebsiella pneumoniae]|uniref:Putative substrate-binding transport protein n=1 Tax=Klebsiella pneumoniae TaxID=573 RepID=A0A377U1U2_KLEPN|nr:putative substrate-binding transport protein [Klebsiella pneumoniae]